jgi:uncharacterized protein (TIGR00369 family)
LLALPVAAAAQTSGCALQNADGGCRILRCPGGVTVTAEAGAGFNLNDRNGDGNPDSASLRRKAILVDVDSSRHTGGFQVVTPQAIAAVRGTQWAVDVGGGQTSVLVVRGAVAVRRPQGDSVVLRPGGIISGPTVFGLCDAVLYYACFTVIGLEPMALTSEMSIRYLRPALGGELWARADIVSVGRRNIVGNVVAWTDSVDTPVATCQGTYVRPR